MTLDLFPKKDRFFNVDNSILICFTFQCIVIWREWLILVYKSPLIQGLVIGWSAFSREIHATLDTFESK